jgi:N-acetylglucosamine kinase-like BadF-type ATPase
MTAVILAGFDAGQTSCRCRLRRWDSRRNLWQDFADGSGSPVSHLDAEGGEDRFRAALRSSLDAAWATAEAEAPGSVATTPALAAAAIGASGLEQGTALQARAQALMAAELTLPPHRCLATGDERTALHGAFPDAAGIVLISGTGMICLGRNDQGEEARSGGWGWMLDGAGGAFDLGHQGLQLTLRMADGRLPDRPLRQQLWQALQCSSAAEIKALVVRPERSVPALAQLAPLVQDAAAAGDPNAAAILQRSADALAEAVTAVANRLSLATVAISPRGGALEHLPLFRAAVERALEARLPHWHWQAGQADACAGALTLAERLLRPR